MFYQKITDVNPNIESHLKGFDIITRLYQSFTGSSMDNSPGLLRT